MHKYEGVDISRGEPVGLTRDARAPYAEVQALALPLGRLRLFMSRDTVGLFLERVPLNIVKRFSVEGFI